MMRMKLSALQILFVLLVLRKDTGECFFAKYGSVKWVWEVCRVPGVECRGINCYQCGSEKDKDCTISKVDPKYIKSCPSSYSYCRKAVDMYYFVGSKEYRTIRECAKSHEGRKDCYRGRYTRDSYQLTCECKGDSCNRSTRSSTWIVLHVFCLFILIFVLSPT